VIGVDPDEVLVSDLGPPDELHLVHQRSHVCRIRDLVEPLAPDLTDFVHLVGAQREIFQDRMI